MYVAQTAFLVTLGLFLGMLLLLELGRRIGIRRLKQDPEGGRTGVAAVEGALFGLLGLLIAFTFSGAAARFDVRRQLIVEETNAIGTAYLRLDLLPPGAQPALRDGFRRYVDARLRVYQDVLDTEAVERSLAEVGALQREIWSQAVAGCQAGGSQQATILVLSALNQMIDITTTRTMAGRTHPPAIIFGMLGLLALAGALMAGFAMAGATFRSWLHVLGFGIVIALTVYVILDIEYPRTGLIRVDDFDQSLVELRQSMQ